MTSPKKAPVDLRERSGAAAPPTGIRKLPGWTRQTLSHMLADHLRDHKLIVVSNREPYMHAKEGKSSKVLIPASGLVTALEPILRACDGTWIAHGSGDADREPKSWSVPSPGSKRIRHHPTFLPRTSARKTYPRKRT